MLSVCSEDQFASLRLEGSFLQTGQQTLVESFDGIADTLNRAR